MPDNERFPKAPLYPATRVTHDEDDVSSGLANSARLRLEALLLERGITTTQILEICEGLDDLKAGFDSSKSPTPKAIRQQPHVQEHYPSRQETISDNDDRFLLAKTIQALPADGQLDVWRVYEGSENSKDVVLYWDLNGFSTCYISCQKNTTGTDRKMFIYTKTNSTLLWSFDISNTLDMHLDPSTILKPEMTNTFRVQAEQMLLVLLMAIKEKK